MRKTLKQRISTWSAVASVVGVVLFPVAAGAASNNDTSTVTVNVGDTISISSADTVSFAIAPTSGGVVSSDSDVVTVSTNFTGGYNLTVIDNDTDTALNSSGNSFTATSGTKTAPAVLSNGEWGFAVASGTTGIGTNGFDASYSPAEDNEPSSTSKWAGMPSSSGTAVMLKTTSSTASNDTTTVWYAAKANTSQPTGSYTDLVKYTATTN